MGWFHALYVQLPIQAVYCVTFLESIHMMYDEST